MAGLARAEGGRTSGAELTGSSPTRIGELLDDVRPLIVLSATVGAAPTLYVDRDAYEEIAGLRRFDTDRGNPLLVLGAELRPDDRLARGEVRVE